MLVAVLLVCFLLPQAYASDVQPSEDEGYILDQTQTEDGYYFPVVYNYPVAQSFVPSLTPLAKVRLYIRYSGEEKPRGNYPLQVSIRDDLDEEDLTSVTIDETIIPDTYTWVNFDFEDITVQPGSTYYIVVDSLYSGGEYHWAMWQSEDIDKYEPGKAWFRDINGIVKWISFPFFSDFCFKTYSYAGKESDLSCDGVFGWPEQVPGSTLTDSFTIENVGDEKSLLNWEIASYPGWGTWIFAPMEGQDLQPEDGPVTIMVTVEVPDEENADFSGEITIVNKDNESDTCTVPISLSTPKNKGVQGNLFNWLPLVIQWFLTHIPLMKLFMA